MSKKRQGSGSKSRSRAPKPEGRARPVPLWRIVSGVLVTLLLIFLFTSLAALHKLQTFVLDARMRTNDPPAESEVVVVKIDDDDYQKIFGGRSPLDPPTLRGLIDAVALGRPKVIGVDIDTSAPQFRDFKLGDKWPPVVWVREPKHIPESAKEPVEHLNVLGGKDPALNASAGSPVIHADAADGKVRRYRRLIETSEGPFPSLAWALVSRFPTPRTQALQPTGEDFFINYAGDPEGSHRFNLSALRTLKLAERGSLPEDNVFAGKIVLIGGAYMEQDQHATPLGTMRGVDVLAQIIETELAGGGDHASNKLTIILLELFEGVVVVLLFQLLHRYRFAVAAMLILLALFAVSIVCSLTAFYTPARFPYFLPLLFCVLIYEFNVEYRITFVKWLLKIWGVKTDEAH
jgi:CHASE2 domain-containing sensor protein